MGYLRLEDRWWRLSDALGLLCCLWLTDGFGVCEDAEAHVPVNLSTGP